MARSGPILLLASLALACAEPPLPPAPGKRPLPGFSGERSFAHLSALAAEPRVPGSEAEERARTYLRTQLQALGLEVLEQSDALTLPDGTPLGTVANLIGVVPGESTDLVVLAAPFDSQDLGDLRFLGANDGASGAALLLELGRVFAEEPLPYTIWLAFLGREPPIDAEHPDRNRFIGSRLLVGQLMETKRLDDVRVAVYFNQVADRELRIARDLRSHRRYRNAFFEAAQRLGYAEHFPAEAPFEQPPGGHLVFGAAGCRRAVVITDDRFGGDEAPGLYSHTEQDDLEHTSAQSLEVVGRTSEAALRDITGTLAKIDRFARRPESSEPVAPVEPETPETAETAEGEPVAGSEALDAEAPQEPQGTRDESAEPPPAAPASGLPIEAVPGSAEEHLN